MNVDFFGQFWECELFTACNEYFDMVWQICKSNLPFNLLQLFQKKMIFYTTLELSSHGRFIYIDFTFVHFYAFQNKEWHMDILGGMQMKEVGRLYLWGAKNALFLISLGSLPWCWRLIKDFCWCFCFPNL